VVQGEYPLVTWKKRRLEAGRTGESFRFEVFLENDTEENESPIRADVKPLGSIEERFLTSKETGVRAFHQGLFWITVDKNLDALRLNPVLRGTIEKEIMEMVPRPKADWALFCVKCIPEYDK
jgi:hypothetical protein